MCVLLLMKLSSYSNAELSPSNEEAYTLYKQMMEPFRQCVQSVNRYNYWKYESGCYLLGEEMVGGSCDENISTSSLNEFVPATSEHCLMHKPTQEQFFKILNQEKVD